MKKANKAGFNAKPNVTTLRNQMKYKVSTTSLTTSGVVPIRGATKYPSEPSIYFTREAWVKQCHLVHKCTMEVGWFALVDYDENDNSFTITELVIPKQEVTHAETDIGKEDLAGAAMELIEAGKDTSKMFAWFHSHVDMGVSPSVQDEYQVEDFLEDLADQPEVPAFIRGIQNKKGDLKLDVYYIQHGVAYQNVDFTVIHDDDPQWLKDIEGEITTKVSARVQGQYNGGFGGGRHNMGKSQDEYQPQYGNFWDDNVDYHDYIDIYETEQVNDIPNAPKALDIDYVDYVDFDIVYQSTAKNMEVLLNDEGRLLVVDAKGDVYDYAEYTEAFGEIDGTKELSVIALIFVFAGRSFLEEQSGKRCDLK